MTWVTNNYMFIGGGIATLAGLLFGIDEFRTYYNYGSSTENLIFWSMIFIGGVTTLIFQDLVLGVLLGLSLLVVSETVRLWDTPVWGKLMGATMAYYLVILFGKIGQMAYDYIVQPANPNDQIFSAAFNISFYVFIIVAFIFFGKKFILVSRFSSPQIVYLALFGVVYFVIATVFPRDNQGLLETYNYLGIPGRWKEYVIFADFGTFEALAILMLFMYFISGYLLSFLMNVRPVQDKEILEKVQKVANQMGIDEEVKVGFVRAPILNAFAYGPWFDKRIAFIADDLDEFSDSDIRGIVGHELAHAANHHVLLLTGLSIIELGIKKGLGLPATTLDYTFIPDTAVVNVSFVQYYIISYGLLIILLIFVRILEGHADKKTKEAGYAKDLSQALYRLEGFYNGVASDFGISVNLLTDRTYSEAEKRRFNAEAGKALYSRLLSPSRLGAFTNIFQSHPRTSYRIASLIEDELDPIKGAFLPYRLLGFGLREGAIKQLNSVKDQYYQLIDQTYINDYGEDALSKVREYTTFNEIFHPLLDRQVIAFDQFANEVYTGKLEELKDENRVTSPVHGIIDGKEVDFAVSIVKEYYPNEDYFLKDGSKVTLLGYEKDDEEVKVKISENGEERDLKLQYLGKPVNYFEEFDDKKVLHYDEGSTSLATINKFETGDNFQSSKLIVDGEERMGKEFSVDFAPLGFEVKEGTIEEQSELLEYLTGKKIMVYTKDNFDVPYAGVLKEITDESIKVEDPDEILDLKFDRLEYMAYSEDTIELITNKHITIQTRLMIKWSNRKEFNYLDI